MKPAIPALVALTVLTSCGGVGSASVGSLNPFNWFGSSANSSATPETVPARQVRDDGRATVAQVLSTRLDYAPQGIIVRAEALVPAIGYHSATLRPINFGTVSESGNLAYEFRAIAPEIASPTAGASSSNLAAGTFVSSSRLGAVNSITVRGIGNEVTVRLR